MRPEDLNQAYSYHQEREALRERMKELKDEDPGPPPGSENLSPSERYQRIYKYAESALGSIDRVDDYGSHQTPQLPVKIGRGEFQQTYLFYFEVWNFGSKNHTSVEALWSDGESFRYNPLIREVDIRDDQINSVLQRELNELDWSLVLYQDAVSRLSKDELVEYGFKTDFIDTIITSRHNPTP